MTKPIKNPKQENKGEEVDQSLVEHSENAEFEISQFFTEAAGEPSASNPVLEEARQELNAPITHKDFYDHTVPQKRVHMFFYINLIGLYLIEY